MRRRLMSSPGRVIGRLRNPDSSAEIRQQQMAEARKTIQSVDPSKWAEVFTSPPLQLEDITCHVEVQVTQRKPGRCVKLGGHIPACQSNEIVSVDTDECHWLLKTVLGHRLTKTRTFWSKSLLLKTMHCSNPMLLFMLLLCKHAYQCWCQKIAKNLWVCIFF